MQDQPDLTGRITAMKQPEKCSVLRKLKATPHAPPLGTRSASVIAVHTLVLDPRTDFEASVSRWAAPRASKVTLAPQQPRRLAPAASPPRTP